jgi:hypothetical protein
MHLQNALGPQLSEWLPVAAFIEVFADVGEYPVRAPHIFVTFC